MFHIRRLCSGEVSSKRHAIEFTCTLLTKTRVSTPTVERTFLAARGAQLHNVGNNIFGVFLSGLHIASTKKKARTGKGMWEGEGQRN